MKAEDYKNRVQQLEAEIDELKDQADAAPSDYIRRYFERQANNTHKRLCELRRMEVEVVK